MVSEAIGSYLASRNIEFAKESSTWPLAVDGENFQINESFPSILSYKRITPDVVEVHFNSFSKLKELASHISNHTKSPVVVNIYQSAAEASYWSYHLNDVCLREIEAGDGEIHYQSGVLLEFEDEPLGHDISDDDEPFFIFNDEDLNFYNENVGIEVEVYQEYSSNWDNFVIKNLGHTQRQPKPWWQFW